jgi:hypothetical protein
LIVQVFTTATTKIKAFWDIASRLTENYKRFRDAYFFHHQGDNDDYDAGGNK